MTHVTCKLTAKNWDQLWNPMLGNRVQMGYLYFFSLAVSKGMRAVKLCTNKIVQFLTGVAG